MFFVVFIFSNFFTFALPGSPSSNPSLSIGLSSHVSNIHVNSSDITNSAFKTHNLTVNVKTNDATGYKMSLSDSDDNTDLIGTLPTNTFRFSSILSDTDVNSFTPNTWGYSLDQTNFKPIPKKSSPNLVKTTATQTPTSGDDTNITIGIKVAPSIPSDTYQDTLEVSVVTNYSPSSATFKKAKFFKDKLTTS